MTRIDLDPSKLLGFKLVLPQVKIGAKPFMETLGPKIGEKSGLKPTSAPD